MYICMDEYTIIMEKRYKYYITKREKCICGFFVLLFIAGTVWMILRNEYSLLLFLIGPLGTCLFYPFSYRLTDDNLVDVRHFLGSTVKSFSVNQIIRITQRSKNEVVLVYNRDGLRGDRILRLSEVDMMDFLDELLQRNPTVEFSKK